MIRVEMVSPAQILTTDCGSLEQHASPKTGEIGQLDRRTCESSIWAILAEAELTLFCNINLQ